MARIATIDDLDLDGTRVLLRVDINSPIDPDTGRIADETRIDKSLPTIRDLADGGARLTIIAHQGDTLDYHNLVGLEEHAGETRGEVGTTGRLRRRRGRTGGPGPHRGARAR